MGDRPQALRDVAADQRRGQTAGQRDEQIEAVHAMSGVRSVTRAITRRASSG